MSFDNPYSPPQAHVADPQSTAVDGILRDSPRRVGAGRGYRWLTEAFAVFKQAPGIWIFAILLLFVVLIVLFLVPFIGSITQSLISPVLTAGLILGAHALDRGEPMTIGHLFAGFKRRLGALIAVGSITLLTSYVIFFGAFAASGLGFDLFLAIQSGEMTPEMIEQLGPAIALAFLIGMALLIPLFMAIWFAPALLVLHEEVGVFQAMKMSFFGCLKNILPFLVYGLVGLLFSILATIPLALGWLVLMPMIYASMYIAYKDLFLD